MKITTNFIFLLFVILGAGCSTSPKVQTDSNAENPVISKVTLIDQGAEPRQVLRYSFNPDFSDTMALEFIYTTITEQEGTVISAFETPAMCLQVVLQSSRITNNGSCRYIVDINKAGAYPDESSLPGLVDIISQEMQKMCGVQGTGMISPLGIQSENEIISPKNVDDETQTMMEQIKSRMQNMSPPLPIQAVGVGARWSTTDSNSTINLNGTQTHIYELNKFTENGVDLIVEIIQELSLQKSDLPGLPEGPAIALDSSKSIGSGYWIVDFSRFTQDFLFTLQMYSDTNLSTQKTLQEMDIWVETVQSGTVLEGKGFPWPF